MSHRTADEQLPVENAHLSRILPLLEQAEHERARHQAQMAELRYQVKQVQQECPHPRTRGVSNPFERWVECEDCGARQIRNQWHCELDVLE